jgi:CBS domain-containing protein
VSKEVVTEIETYYDKVAYDFINNTSPMFIGKQVIRRASYTVLEGGKPVGVLTFGDVPAAEITSKNEKLLGIVTRAMVNPVEARDEEGGTIYASIGSPLFEDAVLALAKTAGFTTVKR